MKKVTSALVLALLALSSGSALAWGRVGVAIGVPIGPYYPAPYYGPYYPPAVVVQQAPVYVEQQAVPVAAVPAAVAPVNYWYYCDAAKGYYPYVKECPGGWQKVAPQPAGPHP